jgi:hypothetical protein
METIFSGQQTKSRARLLPSLAMASVLTGLAIGALVGSSSIEGNEQLSAPSRLPTQSQPTAATTPRSVPPEFGDVGNFAFGWLVFDWDPKAPGGVPGFDSWPPGSHR